MDLDYNPETNGKVERLVQTSLGQWAYARAYDTPDQRRAELAAFLFRYTWHRPHGGINGTTPISCFTKRSPSGCYGAAEVL